MTHDSGKWVDIDGIRTFHVEAGQGVPVLFLHGGVAGDGADADASGSWNLILDGLGEGYRAIAMDRLGQGRTALPEREQDWSMEAAIAHVRAFISQVCGGPVHLVGHGSGAYAALSIATRDRALVRSCTLVSGHLASPTPPRHELVLNANPHPPFSAESQRFVVEAGSISHDHMTREWLAARTTLLQGDANRAAYARMVEQGLHETIYLPYLRIDREALFPELERRSIRRPVLLVWGFDDPIAPLAGAYDLYDLLARHEHRVEMHVINRCGHYPFREHPGEFTRVLTGFFEDVRHGA